MSLAHHYDLCSPSNRTNKPSCDRSIFIVSWQRENNDFYCSLSPSLRSSAQFRELRRHCTFARVTDLVWPKCVPLYSKYSESYVQNVHNFLTSSYRKTIRHANRLNICMYNVGAMCASSCIRVNTTIRHLSVCQSRLCNPLRFVWVHG